MLVVKTPTALAGTSENISARSFFPFFLTPDDTPLPKNPGIVIIT